MLSCVQVLREYHTGMNAPGPGKVHYKIDQGLYMYGYFRDPWFDQNTGWDSDGIMDLILPVEGITTSAITFGPKRSKDSIYNNIWTQV